jgi:hypothetical protein
VSDTPRGGTSRPKGFDVLAAGRVSLDALMKLTWPLLLGAATYTWTAINDHDRRLLTIESTRYTEQDASADRASAVAGRAELRELIVRSEVKTTEQLRQILAGMEELKADVRDIRQDRGR